jgi:hypothetical protein
MLSSSSSSSSSSSWVARAAVASARPYALLDIAAVAGLNTRSMTCSARRSQKALEVVVKRLEVTC